MFAAAPPIFDGLDAEDVDEQARFLAAIVAVAEFGRPADDDECDRLKLFEAGMAEALIVSLAIWIAHPHQDGEQRGVILEKVIRRLRTHVCNMGAPADRSDG